MRTKVVFLVTVAATGLSLAPSPAAGHAVLTRSTPGAKARVSSVPAEIALRFTEPPTRDAVVTITDGCDREVGGEVDVLNAELTTTTVGAQPGRWTVAYQVVSAVDGHPTSGSFSFRVRGAADCDAPPPTIAGGGRTRDGDSREGSLVPLLIGGGALVLLAVVGGAWLRRGD